MILHACNVIVTIDLNNRKLRNNGIILYATDMHWIFSSKTDILHLPFGEQNLMPFFEILYENVNANEL